MPNLYAWLSDIKNDLDITGTTYDAHLLRSLDYASRMVDKLTGWRFYPQVATRHFDVESASCHYVHNKTLYPVEPLLAITSISMSSDDGATYTALAASDYYTSRGGNYEAFPWTEITLSQNGNYSYWYTGQRSVKIVGVWGYREDYTQAWETTTDSVQNVGGISAAATSITVTDADGAGMAGYTPRFQVGQLLRIESEYLEVSAVNTTTNALTVYRGRNGSTAAAHLKDVVIYAWRPQELAANCTRIQSTRWFKRAQQAFQDVSAAIELGQLTYAQELDPDLRSMLKADLVRLV